MNRYLKEKVITICTIIVLIFIAVFIFGSTTASADSNLRVNERKFFTSHVVKSGDTLWALAKFYYGDGSKYSLISSANSDITNPNLIYPGQVLVIPKE